MGRSNPKPTNPPKHFLELGVEEVTKAYLRGATDTNKPYGSLAGKKLQAGDGELMGLYNSISHKIKKIQGE